MPSRYDDSGFDLAKDVSLGYANYFLREDPFPSFTITDEEPEIFVDRVELMTELQKFITAVYKSGDSDAFVVRGEYGDGKTHILKYLKKEINSTFANLNAEKSIAAYVRPGGSMLDFLSNFAGSLGLAFLSETLDEYVKQLIGDPKQISPRDLFGSPLTVRKGRSTPLDQVRVAMESNLLQTIGSADLLSALVAIAQREDRITAWSWLKGLSITAQDRKRLNIAASLKEDNALNVLTGLIRFLHHVGYKIVFILFDELEEISELPDETRRDVYLNYLRQFIDDNQQGVALIFGTTTSGWDAIGKFAEALQRRIVMQRVKTLTNFSEPDAIKLVQAYLEAGHNRFFELQGSDQNTMLDRIAQVHGHDVDAALFPYSQESIRKVLELARHRVGFVLKGLKILMKAGYIEGKYYKTADDVATVIPSVDILDSGA